MIFPIAELNKLFLKEHISPANLSIWGMFGVGKTTLALQLALRNLGAKKKILYLYSKPSFPFEKFRILFQSEKNIKKSLVQDLFTLLIIREFEDLYNFILKFEFLFLENNGYDILIIDSLTELYKLNLNSKKINKNIQLNYILNQIMGTLSCLNHHYDLELIIVNELSIKSSNGTIIETQTGGKVIDFWILNSLKIERTKALNKRKIILTKSEHGLTFNKTINLTHMGFG